MKKTVFITIIFLGFLLFASQAYALSVIGIKDNTPKDNPCDKSAVPDDIYKEFKEALAKFLAGDAVKGLDKQIADETGPKKTVPIEIYIDDLDGFKKQYKDDRDGIEKDKTVKELEEDAENIYNSHPAYTYTTDKKVNGVQVIKVKFFCGQDLRLRTIDNNESSGWKLYEQMLHEFLHAKIYSYDVLGAKPPFDDHDDNPDNDGEEEFFKRFKKYFEQYKNTFAVLMQLPEDDFVMAEEKITLEDLGVKDPGMVPGDRFYFLKEWRRGFVRAFTFNAVKKAEFELDILNEKAAEILKIQETNPESAEAMEKGTVKFFNERSAAISKAVENYEKSQTRLMTRMEKLKETSQNPKVDALLTKLVDRLVKHNEIFVHASGLIDQIREDDQVKFELREGKKGINAVNVKLAREGILKTIAVASEKDEPEKFASRLEKVLEKSKGGDLKRFRSIEFIDDLEDTFRSPSGLKDTLKTQVRTSSKPDDVKGGGLELELEKVRADFLDKLSNDFEKVITADSSVVTKQKKWLASNFRIDTARDLLILEELRQKAEEKAKVIRDNQSGRVVDILSQAIRDLEKTIIEGVDIKQQAEEQIKRSEAKINELESELAEFAINEPGVLSAKHAINTKGGGANSGKIVGTGEGASGVAVNEEGSASSEKTGPIRIDPTPARISTNMTIERQTPKTDFGDRMKAGLDQAGGMLANAKAHLLRAKTAFAEGKYGEAFGQARSAEVFARNGLREINKIEAITIKQRQAAPSSAMPIVPGTDTEGADRKAFPEAEKRVFPETNNRTVCDDVQAPACLRGEMLDCRNGKWVCIGPATGGGRFGPACTQEAKLCPDGSAVGRTGPNCEFALCPVQTAKPIEGVFCTQEFNPVCGANGKTYGNACMAKIAGVEVKYAGECPVSSIVEPRTGTAPGVAEPTPLALAFYEFKLEADDYGFYPNSTITVLKGSRVKIHFIVRATSVYYGGLDFRSSKFKTESVKPGGTATVEFIADDSFVFTSYWPLSSVQKASGKVVAQ